jgi:hypothetical protein
MWIIDKFLGLFGDSTEKAKDLIEENIAKIDDAIEKAGDFIDDNADTEFRDERIETLRIELTPGMPLPPQGILKDMGYRVGKSGLLLHERREILRRTFRVQLVSSSEYANGYVAEWGLRCSQARFNKMDRVLGGLAANAEKIRKNDMSEAIRNWKQDQDWLRQNYRDWLHDSH